MWVRKQVANLMTLCGLCLGVLALIIFVHDGSIGIVITLILVSSFLDYFDGRVARKLKTESFLGHCLDLTNDIFTFIFVPVALLFHVLSLWAFFVVAIIFMGSAFMRLMNQQIKKIVTGVPVTIAAYFLMALVLTYLKIDHLSPAHQMIAVLYVSILGVLMNSEWPLCKKI